MKTHDLSMSCTIQHTDWAMVGHKAFDMPQGQCPQSCICDSHVYIMLFHRVGFMFKSLFDHVCGFKSAGGFVCGPGSQAFLEAMCTAIREQLGSFAQSGNNSVKAVLVTSEGGRAFSAGGDIARIADEGGTTDHNYRYFGEVNRVDS